MSPPPSYRDWWLAAALTSATLPAALPHATAASMPSPIGVVTALAPNHDNTLHIGSDISQGQQLNTDANSPLHILFLDQSALTLGPDSALTIEEFTYDPEQKTGQIRLNLTQGTLRIVGGYISKNTPAVITTPFSTVEILGGISMVSVTPNASSATFLFGQQMRVSHQSGGESTVTRPGFSVDSRRENLSEPSRMPSQQLSQQLSQLEKTQTAANPVTSTPSAPPVLVSTSDRPALAALPNQQLAPDRIKSNIENTAQANPTLILNKVLSSNASTLQS